MNKDDVLVTLKSLKPILYKQFSVKKIGIFGSFADKTNTDDSDIDIIIELEKPIGWKYFSLEVYLEAIFGRKIDLVTKKSLKQQIKNNILDQVNYV